MEYVIGFEKPTDEKNVSRLTVNEVTNGGLQVRRVVWRSSYEKLYSDRHIANLVTADRIRAEYEYVHSKGGEAGLCALGEYGRHIQKTKDRVDELSKDGFLFIAGNNPRMNETKKWFRFEIIRVAQTNRTDNGRCKKTLWAVRPKRDLVEQTTQTT